MNYAFATNTDTASKGNYRFEIVMKPLPPVVAPNAIVTDKLTVKVTPNPVTNGTVKITYASPEALPITIKIMDALGKTIYSSNKGRVQNGAVDVPTATWNNAVYMIQVSNGKETITQKVVKQ
jgi:hypothetical protein